MAATVGLLLAAGRATRFGAEKLLQPLPDGRLIAEAAAVSLVAAVPDSIAIVRPGADQLRAVFTRAGLRVVENGQADRGMSSSIIAGVHASEHAAGWLIALADMPWIAPQTMRMLAQRLHGGGGMLAPLYRHKRGNPVGFSSRWKAQLLRLQGDRGARGLLGMHPEALELLQTNDPGILRDVDVPEDLQS